MFLPITLIRRRLDDFKVKQTAYEQPVRMQMLTEARVGVHRMLN